MLVGYWIGCAAFNASLRSSSICFFSLSGIVLSFVTSSISFLMATVGSENTLVVGSMPAMMLEMVAATSSYSVKLVKPCFLAMLSNSACILGSGFSAVPLCSFSAKDSISFCAAMNASICFSVSLTCLASDCADADVENCARAIAAKAASTSRSACCMGVFLVCRSQGTG